MAQLSPDTPTDADASTTPRKRWHQRWWVRGLALLAIAWAVVVGPWPTDERSFEGRDYHQRTIESLARATPGMSVGQPLRIGVAEVDLDPPMHLPLAGFSARRGRAMTGIDTRCYARAITIASGDVTVTVLSPDLLLVNRKLADAVLARTGLQEGDIFFAATHTHSGPGGYGDSLLESLVMGDYDPPWFDTLADRLSQAVMRSRQSLTPVEVAFVRVNAERWIRNRIDENQPTDRTLAAWLFRTPGGSGGPLEAAIVVYGAHATIIRPGTDVLSSGYPGALIERAKQALPAKFVLFAAGAVGDCAAVPREGSTQIELARKMGHSLADLLASTVQGADYELTPPVFNLRQQVALPPFQAPVSRRWRWSPVATGWVAGDHAPLHLLELGPGSLLGCPGDVAGQLATAAPDASQMVFTSFSGDYIGYLVSHTTFDSYDAYETRTFSLFGPWLGEYVIDIATRMRATARAATAGQD